MTKDEALKLALDVLEHTQNEGYNLPGIAIREAITAIQETLAQPSDSVEQEPMLTPKMREELNSRLSDHWYGCADEVWRIILAAGTAQPAAQYPTPPQRTWVGLTDEEIKILWIQYRAALPRYMCFANAVLAKSKEKNT